MNKANQRELDKALQILEMNDDAMTMMGCKMLATIQRCGTASDTKTILALIKELNLSHHFYTENHCLVAY